MIHKKERDKTMDLKEMLEKFSEEMGIEEKKTPLFILKDVPEVEKIYLEMKAYGEEASEKLATLTMEMKKQAKAYWEEIEKILVEKEIVKETPLSLSVSNGVMFLVKKEEKS